MIWSLVLKNTGTATLTAPAVNDPNAGPVNCPVGSMAPGTSVTCTPSPHVVTQADVDAGVVSNTATGSALTPGGTSVGSNPSSTDTSIAQSSTLDLVKSATVTDNNADGRTDLSDTIHWTFTVTNSGTTTLTSVVVSDPKAGAVSCPATTLAPEGSTACTAAPYTVTQADVDAGHVDNTATAGARNPSGASVPSNPSTVSTPIAQRPNPYLAKSAAVSDVNGDFRIDLGDVISWSFLVENTGTVSLDSIQVTDPTAGVVSCPTTTLAPGATTMCTTAPHIIDQADVDAGFVENTAFSTGHSAGAGTTRSNDSSTDTPVAQRSSLTMTKSAAVADVDGDGRTDLGDTIQWSFLVTDSGTTTLTAISDRRPQGRAGLLPRDDARSRCLDHLHGHHCLCDRSGRRRCRARRQHSDGLG